MACARFWSKDGYGGWRWCGTWIAASRPVISALLVASGHSVCKFKTRQQQMNDAVAQRAADENIYSSKAAFIAHVHTHTRQRRAARDILRLKSRFLVNHTSRVHILGWCSLCVYMAAADRQLYFALLFGVNAMFIYLLSRRWCEFLQQRHINISLSLCMRRGERLR